MKPLYEEYRPRTWAQVVGQNKAIQTIQTLARRGLGGRVLYITGSSGTGKTTIARLVAGELADEYAIIEIDAADMSMDRVREYERLCRVRPIGRGWHVFIVNEAHKLSGAVVSRLLSTFEAGHVQNTSTWIFTTTAAGESLFDENFDSGPFGSRCVQISLSQRNLAKTFAERAREIAQAHGLDGQPIEKYVRLAKDCRNNLRDMLNRIEAGAMIGGAERSVTSTNCDGNRRNLASMTRRQFPMDCERQIAGVGPRAGLAVIGLHRGDATLHGRLPGHREAYSTGTGPVGRIQGIESPVSCSRIDR